MDFRAFVSKFSPPLTTAQVDEIVMEHEASVNKVVKEALEEAEAKL